MPNPKEEEQKRKSDSTFYVVLVFILILFALIVLVPLTLPKQTLELDKDSCLTDSDCLCGGIDKKTSSCFIGNKAYYDLYVDKELYCPDFCEGIAGNFQTKCVNKKCAQVAGIQRECDFDIDCIRIGNGDKCTDGFCRYRSPPTGTGTECAQDEDCVVKNLGNRCVRGSCSGLRPECTSNQDCISQGLGDSCSAGRCSITNISGQCFSDIDCPQPGVACVCTQSVQDCPKARCYSNKCTTVNQCPYPLAQCIKASDCVSSSCCSVPSCVPVSQAPNCTGVDCPCDASDPNACASKFGCSCLKNKCTTVLYAKP